MFRYSFGENALAETIEKAVENVISRNFRTPDIAESDSEIVSTAEMGDMIKAELEKIIAG